MSNAILGHKSLKFIKGYYYAPYTPPFDAISAINNLLENIISGTDEPLNQNILDQIQSSNQDLTDINTQLEEIILSGYDPLERLKNYLTIEALEDGLTAKLSVNDCQYSFDTLNWVDLPANTNTSAINKGQKLYFRGNLTPVSNVGIGTFSISKKCNLSGNCNSMLVGDDAKSTLSLKKYSFAFYNLFSNCSTIIDASQLKLPATSLADSCYMAMFRGCTSLVTAPELPAAILDYECYYGMFEGCTSLVSAPELPATTLAMYCYKYMFRDCTSLVTAPELPATMSATHCYDSMFYGCTSLTTAPELPATTLAQGCYNSMFRNCTSLVTAPALPATTLVNYCYEGMFYGCTKLNYIKALFATTPSSTYTSNWVYRVSSIGTFVKNKNATWNVTGAHGIPSGWTVQTV